MEQDRHKWIRRSIVKKLKTIYDPEIPVDIYELDWFMT
jgi:metal-sulfur cluster biosynthetic enzyme